MAKRKAATGTFWAQDPAVAARRQTKLKLAYAINRAIKSRKLLRARAAAMLDLAPNKVANLRSYHLREFSVEELTGFLAALNRSEETRDHRRQ